MTRVPDALVVVESSVCLAMALAVVATLAASAHPLGNITVNCAQWALHAVGRDHMAFRFARSAGRLGTRSALFAYHRGPIQMGVSRSGAAHRSLQEARAINPAFSPSHAPRAKAALDDLRFG